MKRFKLFENFETGKRKNRVLDGKNSYDLITEVKISKVDEVASSK